MKHKPWLGRALIVLVGTGALGFASGAQAVPLTFSAELSGANEAPAVVTPGTGFAVVDLDVVAHTLRVRATFSGLNGTTTAAHIHAPAVPGTNAGVATQTPSFIGFPLGVTAGSFDNTFDTLDNGTWNAPFITANGGTAAGAEAALLADLLAGLAYFNIHTSFRGGGEIRGNFAAVPEPEALGLFTLGLFGLGLIGLMTTTRRRST